MASKRNFSEAKTLLIYETTLANTRNSKDIAKYMSSVGYDSIKMDEGDALLAKTKKASRTCTSKKHNINDKYKAFSDLSTSMLDSFTIHRKTARVAFRKDKENVEQLALNEEVPKAYSAWLELIKKFYAGIENSKKIQEKLSELNLEIETISDQQEMILELEKARADYLESKAESQKATKAKDEAFDELYEWMKDFYEMAKVAMRNDKKLLISFGKGPAISR